MTKSQLHELERALFAVLCDVQIVEPAPKKKKKNRQRKAKLRKARKR